MTDYIFLNGHPLAGKDTLANEFLHWKFKPKTLSDQMRLSIRPTVRHEKFADPLTHIIKAIYSLHDLGTQGIEYLEKNKNNPNHKYADRLMGRTWREAKIHTSESVLKPAYGQSYFGDVIANKIKAGLFDYADFVVFSDSGFSFELNPVVKAIDDPNKIHIVKFSRDINGERMYDDEHFYYFDNEGNKKKDSRYFVNLADVNKGIEFDNRVTEARNVLRIEIGADEKPSDTALKIFNWILIKKQGTTE